MSTGQRPDPRRRKTPHAHATNLKVPNKGKAGAWKAGELYGCYTHRTFASQPCLHDITQGELKCPCCAAKIESTWRGYVPLWDVDWCVRYALIGEDLFESVDAVPFREQVVLSRGASVRSPLVIRPEVSMLRELPNRPPWDAPINMLAICLTLWKCPELDQWFRDKRNAEAVARPAKVLKSDGKPFGPMTAAAARRFAPPVEPDAASKTLDKALASLAKKAAKLSPSTNGKGDH